MIRYQNKSHKSRSEENDRLSKIVTFSDFKIHFTSSDVHVYDGA